MVITESIQKAIQAAIDKSGSLLSFSRSIGVTHTTVAYWLSGRTRKINSTVWLNLYPLIKDHLGTEEAMSYPYSPAAAGNTNCIMREHSQVWYGTDSGAKASAPLLGLDDLADFDPQIDSLEEIIREKAKSAAVFTSPVLPGYFAVEIDRKHSGFFAEGTRLLLRGQDAPGNGNTVLVKLRDKKDFLFAVYTRNSDEVVLTPLPGGGRKRRIPRDKVHNVCCWIVAIREAVQVF